MGALDDPTTIGGIIMGVVVVLATVCCVVREFRERAPEDPQLATADNDSPARELLAQELEEASSDTTREDSKSPDERHQGPPEIFDPLVLPSECDDEALQVKYADFYRAGGRVIEAPDQDKVATMVAAGQRLNWSIGIHEGDFLVPVCHQGMNRSQVMRLVLTKVVEDLDSQVGRAPTHPPGRPAEETPWVSRAHGAVSGCDPHCAYGPELGEENFFGYIFDDGSIFAPDYDPNSDEDPQQGPLQRAFIATFKVKKQPRVGEEMARPLNLNPTSEYTTPPEFQAIGRDREAMHTWFNKWFFAPIERIADESLSQQGAPTPDQLTLPPAGAQRRIFFAFARAVPGVIERLLEAKGAQNSVVVSLQYDDIMNHQLRHCKTEAELEVKLNQAHQKAFDMYRSLVHADPTPAPSS